MPSAAPNRRGLAGLKTAQCLIIVDPIGTRRLNRARVRSVVMPQRFGFPHYLNIPAHANRRRDLPQSRWNSDGGMTQQTVDFIRQSETRWPRKKILETERRF